MEGTKKSPKLKLDQGYKSMTRGLRKSFFVAFEKSGFCHQFYRYNEARWLLESENFLKFSVGLTEPSLE
jgi:hypothetical protein